MAIKVEDYLSKKDPEKYKGCSHKFIMSSSYDTEVSIISYAGIIESLIIPDKNGKKEDVVLGLKGLDEYLANGSNHGSLVGRSANRISGAAFEIDGQKYELEKNDGENNLHSGPNGFHRTFWEGKVISKAEADKFITDSGIDGIPMSDGEAILLTNMSPDGSDRFPGNLKTDVMYAWLEDKTLLILYAGNTDKATIFAPTNHAYFNIAGHNKGRVDNQLIIINSDYVNHKNECNCPDGPKISVEGTDFDVREAKPLSVLINSTNPQITMSLGPDQNYILKGQPDKFSYGASLVDTESGRIMEVVTNFPGIQIYTGNHLGGNDQKGDIPYKQYGAVCLEAQLVPNAVNLPDYDSPVIRPGETKYYACGYRFTV